MESSINERISLILSKFGYKSKRSFADKIGIAQTSFNDILNGAEPKFSTLLKILLAEPLISSEWLMRGKGNMLLSDETLNDSDSNVNKEIETLKAELNMMKGENRVLREQLGLASENAKSKSA